MDHCLERARKSATGDIRVESNGPPPHETAQPLSVLLLASFFAAALARQRFFYALSFAGFQVERVTFDFLNYVLGLYLALEPAKCVLKGFSLLKTNLSQSDYTPLLALTGPVSYGKADGMKSSGLCRKFPFLLRN
jgi:hypothetical protein